jgi:hypothetical protein
MVTNINIQLDDEDADFVRGVKDRTGETWATWIVEAAEAVEHLNRIEETAENEAFRAAKEAVESKRNRIDDVRTYDAREAAVTDDTVEDDREVIEADTNPSRPRQDDVSGEEGPSWGSDPSPDDYDRLEAEIPGTPGTPDMKRKVDAVIVMWDHLREVGKADKDAMMDAAADEIEATGYADAISFWSNVVKGSSRDGTPCRDSMACISRRPAFRRGSSSNDLFI